MIYDHIRKTCMILLIIFVGGCCFLKSYPEAHPCNLIPDIVSDYFSNNSYRSTGLFYDSRAYSIIDCTHPDLCMTEIGKLSSKKYGWVTNLTFEPQLKFENDGFILISESSEIRFSCFTYLTTVIRKIDGKVVNCISSKSNILEEAIFDDIYFFKLDHDPRIHCMKIGE